MYTFDLPDFVFRSCLRSANLRSAPKLNNHFVLFLSELDAVRFLLWWLFLHRRLRSRQRGPSCDERLLLTSWWFLAKKRYLFLSKQLMKNLAIFPASLSASIQGVNSNAFRQLLLSNRNVATPLASPCTGQKPVSVFDCKWILHPFFSKSSRKYFNSEGLN
jgi:hypothetical protein